MLDIKIKPVAEKRSKPTQCFIGLVARGRPRCRCLILGNIKMSSGLTCCKRVAVKRGDMLNAQFRGVLNVR